VKNCSKCKQEKAFSEFNKDKRTKSGLTSECKLCKNTYLREHPEISRKGNKNFYLKHKDEISKWHKEYWIKIKDTIKESRKLYRDNHKADAKRWRDSHKKEIKLYNDTHRKEACERTTNRRNIDINFKLAGNLRTRNRHAMQGRIKSKKTLDLLGCSIEFFRNYLENKFTEGMSWENYGKGGWEVDHIKQCIKFDLTKSKEQHKCFHYINLQPLWLEENRGKNERLF
jgi:hypothetical protein